MMLSGRTKRTGETRVTLTDPAGPTYSVWVTTAPGKDGATAVRFARAYRLTPAAGWTLAGRGGLALRVAGVAGPVMTCEPAGPKEQP